MIFSRLRGNHANSLVGMDISANSIKLLVINKTDSACIVENFAMGSLPADIIIKNEIKNYAVVSDVIENLFVQAEINTKLVSLAIPRSLAIFKTTTIDGRLSKTEIESRAWLEANRLFPELVDNIYLDFTVLGPASQDAAQLELMLIACRKDQIQPYLEVLRLASLTPKIVDVSSYALERALTIIAKQLPNIETIALLNLDLELSTLLVVQAGSMVYAHDQSFEGNRVMAQLQNAATSNMDIFKQNLSAHLRHTMHIFYSSRPNSSIQKLVLSGDCAMLPGLPLYLQEEVGIETIVANPFAHMGFAPRIQQSELQAHAPALMLSCGLALGQIR